VSTAIEVNLVFIISAITKHKGMQNLKIKYGKQAALYLQTL
jgi:hypothetical protein